MELSLKKISLTKLMRIGIGVLAAVMIAACGGGGGSPGTTIGTATGTGTSTGNGTIQVILVDASGVAKNTVTNGNPLLAKATVTDDLGAPLKDKIVKFSLSTSMATIVPADGTALTDINGVAQVNIQSAGLGGAGEVIASVTVGAAPVTAKAAFSVGAAPTAAPAAINFVNAVPADKSIVIKGAGGNGRTETALLTFVVVDSANVGVSGIKVNFTAISTKSVALTSTSGTTDASGKVVATLNSGIDPTTVRVTATVQGTAISIISDTVTITTGQPTQTRMTLAREKDNVEGINYFGETNAITVFMADDSGGVVANGTQIVFTTDSGAIVGDAGTSDTARCLTTNGECSVLWRSQNPPKSVVTVIATATITPTNATPDGLLYASIPFTSSGSFAVATPTAMNNLTTAGNNVWNLNFPTDCSAQTIQVTVTDANGYTMPDATTLKIENALSSTMTIFPDKIVAPNSTEKSLQASKHEITVKPTGCTVKDGTFLTDSPVLSIATPLGGLVQYRINLTFPK